MKFTDFVDIKSNLSDFNPDWLISVCKRENNSKRDFIFVNRIQGKHVPARPQEILHLFENLRVTITKDSRWNRKENNRRKQKNLFRNNFNCILLLIHDFFWRIELFQLFNDL